MALHNKNLNYKTMNTGSAVEKYTNLEDVKYNDTELGMFDLIL